MTEKSVRLPGIRHRRLRAPAEPLHEQRYRWQPQDCPRPLRPVCSSSDPIRGVAPAERRSPARARTTRAGRARGCAVAHFRSLGALNRLRVCLRLARGLDATTQPVYERPLNTRLLLFQCLLDPSILKHLTPRGQEVVRQQQNRLGRSAYFRAFVLAKACRPSPKLLNLLVVNQEDPSPQTRQT